MPPSGRMIATALQTHTPLTDPFPQYLSGHPYFYPLVASFLDAWGGVEAARLLSLAAMLGATACVYWIAQHLYGRECATYSAALYAFQGPVLFLTRLATYDATCVLLIALSVVVALQASAARTPWRAVGIGPLLVLAVFTKYAALLWVPAVLVILAWRTLQNRGWLQMLLRTGMALAAMAATAGLAVAMLGDSFLHAVRGSTTNRVILDPASRLELVQTVVRLGGIGLALALIGCLLVGRRQRLLAVILFGGALLAPVYHIYEAEPISLEKHLAYALVFAAPLAGLAVARLFGYGRDLAAGQSSRLSWPGRNWLAGLAICLLVFTLGVQQANWLYHMWGDSSGMVTVLRSLVRPASGRYMAEDMEVARYYLQDVTADWQWTGPFWFEYVNKESRHLYGEDAYKAAIADGYFDVVELSYSVTASLDHTIDNGLRNSTHYQLVAKTPYSNVYGSGYYWIWRLRAGGAPPPAGGDGVTPIAPSARAPTPTDAALGADRPVDHALAKRENLWLSSRSCAFSSSSSAAPLW